MCMLYCGLIDPSGRVLCFTKAWCINISMDRITTAAIGYKCPPG